MSYVAQMNINVSGVECIFTPCLFYVRFIYETERHNGVAELLEILGRCVLCEEEGMWGYCLCGVFRVRWDGALISCLVHGVESGKCDYVMVVSVNGFPSS